MVNLPGYNNLYIIIRKLSASILKLSPKQDFVSDFYHSTYTRFIFKGSQFIKLPLK